MRAAALLGLAVLCACESDGVGPEGAAVLFRTDRLAYEAAYIGGTGAYAQYGFTVVAEFRNTGATTLYLARCRPDDTRPIWGVVLVGGGDDMSGYGYAWACVGSTGIEIAAGESRTDTLEVRGPTRRDGVTKQPLGVLEGSFRLVYVVRYEAREGSAPERLSTSNRFTVTLADAP